MPTQTAIKYSKIVAVIFYLLLGVSMIPGGVQMWLTDDRRKLAIAGAIMAFVGAAFLWFGFRRLRESSGRPKPETTVPNEDKHSFNWGALFFWSFALLVLYVLSFGPVVGFENNGKPHGSAFFAFEKIYQPLVWAYISTPLHKPLGMYLHLWDSKIGKNGDPT